MFSSSAIGRNSANERLKREASNKPPRIRAAAGAVGVGESRHIGLLDVFWSPVRGPASAANVTKRHLRFGLGGVLACPSFDGGEVDLVPGLIVKHEADLSEARIIEPVRGNREQCSGDLRCGIGAGVAGDDFSRCPNCAVKCCVSKVVIHFCPWVVFVFWLGRNYAAAGAAAVSGAASGAAMGFLARVVALMPCEAAT